MLVALQDVQVRTGGVLHTPVQVQNLLIPEIRAPWCCGLRCSCRAAASGVAQNDTELVGDWVSRQVRNADHRRARGCDAAVRGPVPTTSTILSRVRDVRACDRVATVAV